jgi:hypothetical protein
MSLAQPHEGLEVLKLLRSMDLDAEPGGHGASFDDLEDFAAFLDDCGGFSIW